MNITIGITTFNRLPYLKKMRQSLYESAEISTCNLRIYDDCSTELSREDLEGLFPDAQEIIVRPVNLGACKNMREMYKDFLKTDDDLLVTADADLIFHPDWLRFVLSNFSSTDGILSLYNSVLHKPKKNSLAGEVELVEKKHIGSAGAVMHRKIIQEIIDKVPPVDGYDWAWSTYLRETGKRLLVSKTSYVQHIGLHGYNCDGFRTIEFGLNFYPGSKLNEQYLIQFFETTLIELNKHLREETIRKPIILSGLHRLKKSIRKAYKTVIKRTIRWMSKIYF